MYPNTLPTAADEATANAVAHRDYATPTQVFVGSTTIGWKLRIPVGCCLD